MEEHGHPILKAAAKEGVKTKLEIARELKMNPGTLHSRVQILGIGERVDELLGVKTATGPTQEQEAEAGRLRDVTTKEGRRTANRALQVKDLKKRNRELEARLLDQENLFDRIVAASTDPLPRPTFRVRASASSKPARHVLLPIFDTQYGQRVVPNDTVGGIGGFDSGVFRARLETYVEKVSALMRSYSAGHRLESMVFALGGDMVEGDEIFAGQPWQLEFDPAEQMIGMRDLLAYAIDALMEVGASLGTKKASVLCVPGNHGKVGGKRGGARPKGYSWDVAVYRLLKERLSNHPIHNFVIERAGNCTFDVAGNLFGMIHGDEVKGWGGLPFYGLTRHDAKMIRTLNVIPQYVLLGHHHQPASIPIGYGEHLMSGNWVGANNLSGIVGSNVPSQWAFFVSKEHGVCDRSLIYLDEKRVPTPTIHQTA